jgi:DNA-binding NtrC family response regulator
MFGHERGAFTGAGTIKQGVFEQADHGTLFLDEIAEMALELQVRLLRVLETGKVKRVGGTKEIDVDVRVIAATNRPTELALREGKLREDLYHRLAVFPILVPPLRARAVDVPLLAAHFLAEMEEAEGRKKELDPTTLEVLCSYQWPGNVRQLRNAVHRAYIMADDRITPGCLLAHIRAAQPMTASGSPKEMGLNLEVGSTLANAERRLIEATLEDNRGDKRATADVLGISLRTLYNRLREYGAATGEAAESEDVSR